MQTSHCLPSTVHYCFTAVPLTVHCLCHCLQAGADQPFFRLLRDKSVAAPGGEIFARSAEVAYAAQSSLVLLGADCKLPGVAWDPGDEPEEEEEEEEEGMGMAAEEEDPSGLKRLDGLFSHGLLGRYFDGYLGYSGLVDGNEREADRGGERSGACHAFAASHHLRRFYPDAIVPEEHWQQQQQARK